MKEEEPKYPAFDEAEARLREFLKSAEWPENVMWIGTEDVAVSGQEFIVHPVKSGREQVVKSYRSGIEKNLGILLCKGLNGVKAPHSTQVVDLWNVEL